MITNLWWCLFPPCNVRVFYRSGQKEIRDKVGFMVAAKAFELCSKREREFILWRDPVFRHFL